MLTYEEVKDKPVVFRSFTGLDKPEFEKLLLFFIAANRLYIAKNHIKGKKRQRRCGGGRMPKLRQWRRNCFSFCFTSKPILFRRSLPFCSDLDRGRRMSGFTG